MLQEADWGFTDDMKNLHACFQVLNKPLQEGEEMLCLSDISRHSLFQKILRQGRICHEKLFVSCNFVLSKSLDKFFVFILKFGAILGLHFVDRLGQLISASASSF